MPPASSLAATFLCTSIFAVPAFVGARSDLPRKEQS